MSSEWTNLDDIRGYLNRFVSTDSYPSAIVLSGAWGTGKTHLWQNVLKNLEHLAKPNYAYISLFGVSGLDDLKYQLFQVKERRDPELEPGEVNSGWRQKIKDQWLAKQIDRLSGEEKSLIGKLSFLSKLPYINSIEPIIRNVSFNSVRETIVCIDDFERKGANLRVIDVLGLVSLLREARNCKVILILNEDTLTPDDKVEFDRLNEKVFDWTLTLNPSPEHAVNCVVPADDPQLQIWLDTANVLRANNIRIIRRAYELVKILREQYADVSQPINEQFVSSLLLFCFSKFGYESFFPSIEDLKSYTSWSLVLSEEEELSEEKKSQMALLRSMNWLNTDAIDLELIRLIEQGYLSRETMGQEIADKEALIADDVASQAVNNAWRIYHDSFADNEQELTQAVYEASRNALTVLSPYNVDQNICLLRDLNRNDLANKLADTYVTQNKDDRKRIDLSEYAFSNEMKDEYFIGKLRDACLNVPSEKDLRTVLTRLGKERGWGGSDEEFLDLVSEEDVVQFLSTFEGDDLSTILKGAMQFPQISDPSERISRIAKKMTRVLRQIAATSPLNARRLQRFGIRPVGQGPTDDDGG